MRSVETLFLDIVLAIQRIRKICATISCDEFLKSDLYSGYVIRELIVIGEASRQMLPNAREQHPNVAMGKMIAMRNLLVHEYFRLKLETIWSIVENELQPLLTYLQPLIPPNPDEN